MSIIDAARHPAGAGRPFRIPTSYPRRNNDLRQSISSWRVGDTTRRGARVAARHKTNAYAARRTDSKLMRQASRSGRAGVARCALVSVPASHPARQRPGRAYVPPPRPVASHAPIPTDAPACCRSTVVAVKIDILPIDRHGQNTLWSVSPAQPRRACPKAGNGPNVPGNRTTSGALLVDDHRCELPPAAPCRSLVDPGRPPGSAANYATTAATPTNAHSSCWDSRNPSGINHISEHDQSPGNPKHHYLTHADDLHELPSVTNLALPA